MPAGIISAVTSIGGSVANGIAGQSNAANNAALAQQAGTLSNQVASNTYNTNAGNFTPYTTAGGQATGALAALLGIGGNSAAAQQAFQNYKNATNYQFQLGQGENAIEYANAPSFNSSATAKALNNYAQGMAGSALTGYESLLGGLGNQGVSASSSLGQLGSQYANQYANNTFGSIGGQITANNQALNAQLGMINGMTGGLSSFANNNASGINSAFNGFNNIIGGPGSATQQESSLGSVAGLI